MLPAHQNDAGSTGQGFGQRMLPALGEVEDRIDSKPRGQGDDGFIRPFARIGAGIVSSANGTLSCLASSRAVKNLAGELSTQTALANVMALRPYTGSYKATPDVPEHWLIAEEVAEVDPALVGLNDGKPHVVKTQNVVADLIAVVQHQQRQIEELRRLVAVK